MGKKKIKFLVFSFFIVMLLTASVLALTNAKIITNCQKECGFEKRFEIKTCNEDYKECRITCDNTKKSCFDLVKESYENCRENCDSLQGLEKRECQSKCAKNKIENKKECSKSQCLFECRSFSENCKNQSQEKYDTCKTECESNVILNKEQCESTGGFFYEICNGPYFDIVCSKDKFCICDGNSQYTCPQEYACNHDIDELLPRRAHTIEGYKDKSGQNLGDIGICQKQEPEPILG